LKSGTIQSLKDRDESWGDDESDDMVRGIGNIKYAEESPVSGQNHALDDTLTEELRGNILKKVVKFFNPKCNCTAPDWTLKMHDHDKKDATFSRTCSNCGEDVRVTVAISKIKIWLSDTP
jgi:hypothetical protein